jgi:16S rRNA (cytidine1402-2'-O)-methyltransferase
MYHSGLFIFNDGLLIMKLYLIPTPLGKSPQNTVLPEHVLSVIRSLDLFFVENVNTARSFLQWVKLDQPDFKVTLLPLQRGTSPQDLHEYIRMIKPDRSAGIMSEAGCPGVADPGASLVAFAHRFNVQVVPLVGPSSILLALMASGLNGQEFTFRGYLPREDAPRKTVLSEIRNMVRSTTQTQIFMEAPQRNNVLLQELIKTLEPTYQLCVAAEITLADEWIKTMSVERWRETKLPDLSKKPVMFLVGR